MFFILDNGHCLFDYLDWLHTCILEFQHPGSFPNYSAFEIIYYPSFGRMEAINC